MYGTCESGSFAECAAAPEQRLAAKPASLSFEQAAVVPISGVTALHAVRDSGRVQPGQQVMVIGAAGAVGSFAVQIAKASGARVTGVCSSPKTGLVRSLGADDVIDYTHDEIDGNRARYDVVIDTAGNRPLSLLRRAMTPHGTLVLVGGEHGGGRVLGGFDRQLLRAPLVSMFAGQRLRGLTANEGAEDLQTITRLIDPGAVRPVIDRTYALADAADAIRYLAQGHAGQGRRHGVTARQQMPSPISVTQRRARRADGGQIGARYSRPVRKPPPIGTSPRPLPTRAPGNIRYAGL